jgi:hypothetical protein
MKAEAAGEAGDDVITQIRHTGTLKSSQKFEVTRDYAVMGRALDEMAYDHVFTC